jgi:hypothetical protein
LDLVQIFGAVLADIALCALLALVQVTIAHPRVLVELADGPLNATLEAGFERT